MIFEPDSGIDEADIDISDERVLLTAAKAREHIQPPVLTRIVVNPEVVSLKPGDAASLSASCFDQHGHPLPDSPVAWSASGGTITPDGKFSAREVGDYRVEARAGSTVGTAQIRVHETITPPPPPPSGFAWQGSVPPQKWMNFYTKVLSPLVAAPGLKLVVQFEVPPGDTAADGRIDAVRAALRDLGLSEDVEPR